MKILYLWKDIFKNIKMQPQKKNPEEKTPPSTFSISIINLYNLFNNPEANRPL